MLFTMNLADFGTPVVIGGSFKTLATEAYLQVISSSKLGKASAISVFMVPAAVLAFFFYYRAMKANEKSAGSDRADAEDSDAFTLNGPAGDMDGNDRLLCDHAAEIRKYLLIRRFQFSQR